MPFSQDVLTRIINIHKKKEEEPPEPDNVWFMICKTGPNGPNGEPDDIVGVVDGTGHDVPLAKCGQFISNEGVEADSPIDPMAEILWYISPGFSSQIREVWIRFPPGAGGPVDPRQEYPPLKPPDAGIPPAVR